MSEIEKLEGITCLLDGAIAVVRLDRESKGNALDKVTLESLQSKLHQLRHDATVRVVILTGTGRDAFSIGADLETLATLETGEALLYVRLGVEVATLIEMLGKPVIGAINGAAIGGGCELALACHMRIAAPDAGFAASELGVGFAPVFGFSPRLAGLIGRPRALELVLTGATLTAVEAERLGLINRIVAADRLIEEASAIAREIARGAPLAMKYALEAINRGYHLSVDEALELEGDLFSDCFTTEDMREGVRAFLEKRAPEFKGR